MVISCLCLGLEQRKDYAFNKILRCINFVLPAPPAPAYAPSMGLPDIMPPNPYVAPDPCNPCNTCAQCSLQVCSPCAQTCQPLSCPPRIPAKLQPLWQQWNERTAGNSFFLYMMYVLFHWQLALFALETDYTSETDNQSSKSVKIDGKTDGQSEADYPSKIKTVPFSN